MAIINDLKFLFRLLAPATAHRFMDTESQTEPTPATRTMKHMIAEEDSKTVETRGKEMCETVTDGNEESFAYVKSTGTCGEELSKVKSEVRETRAEMKTELSAVREEMKAGFASVLQAMKVEHAGLAASLTQPLSAEASTSTTSDAMPHVDVATQTNAEKVPYATAETQTVETTSEATISMDVTTKHNSKSLKGMTHIYRPIKVKRTLVVVKKVHGRAKTAELQALEEERLSELSHNQQSANPARVLTGSLLKAAVSSEEITASEGLEKAQRWFARFLLPEAFPIDREDGPALSPRSPRMSSYADDDEESIDSSSSVEDSDDGEEVVKATPCRGRKLLELESSAEAWSMPSSGRMYTTSVHPFTSKSWITELDSLTATLRAKDNASKTELARSPDKLPDSAYASDMEISANQEEIGPSPSVQPNANVEEMQDVESSDEEDSMQDLERAVMQKGSANDSFIDGVEDMAVSDAAEDSDMVDDHTAPQISGQMVSEDTEHSTPVVNDQVAQELAEDTDMDVSSDDDLDFVQVTDEPMLDDAPLENSGDTPAASPNVFVAQLDGSLPNGTAPMDDAPEYAADEPSATPFDIEQAVAADIPIGQHAKVYPRGVQQDAQGAHILSFRGHNAEVLLAPRAFSSTIMEDDTHAATALPASALGGPRSLDSASASAEKEDDDFMKYTFEDLSELEESLDQDGQIIVEDGTDLPSASTRGQLDLNDQSVPLGETEGSGQPAISREEQIKINKVLSELKIHAKAIESSNAIVSASSTPIPPSMPPKHGLIFTPSSPSAPTAQPTHGDQSKSPPALHQPALSQSQDNVASAPAFVFHGSGSRGAASLPHMAVLPKTSADVAAQVPTPAEVLAMASKAFAPSPPKPQLKRGRDEDDEGEDDSAATGPTSGTLDASSHERVTKRTKDTDVPADLGKQLEDALNLHPDTELRPLDSLKGYPEEAEELIEKWLVENKKLIEEVKQEAEKVTMSLTEFIGTYLPGRTNDLETAYWRIKQFTEYGTNGHDVWNHKNKLGLINAGLFHHEVSLHQRELKEINEDYTGSVRRWNPSLKAIGEAYSKLVDLMNG